MDWFDKYIEDRKQQKLDRPYHYWATITLPRALHRVKDAIWGTPLYWLRTHLLPGHRYHIVHLKNKDNGYDWGWIDRDKAILFACFNLLQDYVEKELHNVFPLDTRAYGGEDLHSDPNSLASVKSQIARTQEAKDLYDWWKVERPQAHKSSSGSNLMELDAKDQEMLHRLIEIRQTLWT